VAVEEFCRHDRIKPCSYCAIMDKRKPSYLYAPAAIGETRGPLDTAQSTADEEVLTTTRDEKRRLRRSLDGDADDTIDDGLNDLYTLRIRRNPRDPNGHGETGEQDSVADSILRDIRE
jgi:hypothetical protein